VSEGLKTDGWAFLNIANPMCAWATYRGVLVSIPTGPGFISVWSASLLKLNDAIRLFANLTSPIYHVVVGKPATASLLRALPSAGESLGHLP